MKYHFTKPNKDTTRKDNRNKEIYRFYVDFMFEKGRAPTLQEIGERFGFSKSRAGQVVERLGREGYLLKLKKYHSSYIPNIFSGHGRWHTKN